MMRLFFRVVAGIYILLVIAAVYFQQTHPKDEFAGIFTCFLGMPWTVFLGFVLPLIVDSETTFGHNIYSMCMIGSCLLNVCILFFVGECIHKARTRRLPVCQTNEGV